MRIIGLTAAAAILWTIATVLASAQDVVKRADGTLLRGEILADAGGTIRMVTTAGEVCVIPAGEVARVKRGKPLDPVVAERLGAIDAGRPRELYALARWALGEKKFARDGRRLMLRVLAINPGHARARLALGHVDARGTWYPSARAAYLAEGEAMKAEGYVYFRQGWVRKELLSFVQANRDDWALYRGFLWRSLAEIRKERGDKSWEQQWYTHEEAKLVPLMSRLRDQTGEVTHGAQAGRSRVVCAGGRKQARQLAERQQKARAWFIRTFDAKARHPVLLKHPLSLDIVLSGEGAFEQFLEHGRKAYGLSERYVEVSRQSGSVSWQGANHCVHQAAPAWEYSMVSALGFHLMDCFFHGGRPPAWLEVATAHHAEIAIFGDAKVQWVRIGHYDSEVKVPKLEGRNLQKLKQIVRDLYRDRVMPGLRVLCSKSLNELTQEHDLVGVVYLSFLLECHREAFLDFLSQPGSNKLPDRFLRHFGKTMEEIDRLFRAWLKS